MFFVPRHDLPFPGGWTSRPVDDRNESFSRFYFELLPVVIELMSVETVFLFSRHFPSTAVLARAFGMLTRTIIKPNRVTY
jgi:hypothetical protein